MERSEQDGHFIAYCGTYTWHDQSGVQCDGEVSRMGKKYIIELEDNESVYKTVVANGYPMIQIIVPAPYTKPDPEQVRKEAYEQGLSDAWEAARKICTNWVLSDSVLSEIFGMDKTIDDIMKENTASEVIAKIQAYEQAQKEIQVGDEVELKCGVSPAIYMQGTNGSDEIYLLFNDGSCGMHSRSEIERKTGRHFPEIAEVLAKMKES